MSRIPSGTDYYNFTPYYLSSMDLTVPQQSAKTKMAPRGVPIEPDRLVNPTELFNSAVFRDHTMRQLPCVNTHNVLLRRARLQTRTTGRNQTGVARNQPLGLQSQPDIYRIEPLMGAPATFFPALSSSIPVPS